MAGRKLIIVACGSGVASSHLVATKLKDLCQKYGINAEVKAVDFRSVKTYLKNADLFVNIAPYAGDDWGVPAVSGIPFMTGVGVDKAMEEIRRILSD